MNIQACLERKPREGHPTRMWWERKAGRIQPQTGNYERKWTPKPLRKYQNVSQGKTRDGMAGLHNSVYKKRTQCPHPIRTPKLSRKQNSLKTAKKIVVGAKYTSEPAQKQGAKRTQVRYNQYDNPYLSRRKIVYRD